MSSSEVVKCWNKHAYKVDLCNHKDPRLNGRKGEKVEVCAYKNLICWLTWSLRVIHTFSREKLKNYSGFLRIT